MKTMIRSAAHFSLSLTWALCVLLLCPAVRAAESPATFKVSEFTFTRPAGWETVETTSQMRKAQFKVTDAGAKEPAEVIFYYFGAGNGGGAQANVDRWFGQFKEPKDQIKAKTEEATVSGHKVTFVQAEGTYMSGMPGGPATAKPVYALAGAIIESSEGNIFVRMTGPRELVKRNFPAFKKMIESASTK
jgi:hypothetical protein